MPAYWVARAKVNDPVEYKKYADRVPAIFAKYGAKVLTRGGRYQTLEGPEKFNRFVVIEFPTFEQGVACFNSREYKEAAAFRRRNKAGENELVMIEAGEGAAVELSVSDSIYGIIRLLRRNRGRPGFDVGIEAAQGIPRTSDLVNPSGNSQTPTTSVS